MGRDSRHKWDTPYTVSHLVRVWRPHSRHKWDTPHTVSHLVRIRRLHSRHKWDTGRRELAGSGERMTR
ncbi:hypothetical protein GCM10010910_00400 [Microbacterium nanhaiense]|uniref:Uncharacterized protein n=1 Tax=Microbacterium nanhaiense TaxID=1301026 RepID=A0ABQ2MVV1_9MICO|nr:hypothetical protein GCM10010910_00400 [Microbacterium nanhaiense]